LNEQAATESGEDLAAQDDDLPPLTIDTGEHEVAILGPIHLPHIIRTASARSIFGCKPGETVDEAIARKEAEEAGAFVEDALSEQDAAESGDPIIVTGDLLPIKSRDELAAALAEEGGDLDELAAELATEGVDLLAALASQGDDQPPLPIITARPRRIDLSRVTHIRTAGIRTL